MKKHYWFRARNYGWGWYPASWQGWTVLAVWFGLFLAIFRGIDKRSHSVSDTLIGFLVPMVVLTAALITTCWFTGERPEWRWAGRPMPWRKVMLKVVFVVVLAFAVAGLTAFLMTR